MDKLLLFNHLKRALILAGVSVLLGSCAKNSSDVVIKPSSTSITTINPTVTSTAVVYHNADTVIFQGGKEGYKYYRIPAVVTTSKGTLLAFAEGRKNGQDDTGDIDIVMKRSTDGGQTWSPLMVVWDMGANSCGNPAPIVDQITGEVSLIMCFGIGTDTQTGVVTGNGTPRRIFYSKSKDDGLTWQLPNEISSTTTTKSGVYVASGPGHGIQLTQGEHVGRLVVPVNYENLKKAGMSLTASVYTF